MAIAERVGKKVLAGERLTRDEGLSLLRDGDLIELGMLADEVRQRLLLAGDARDRDELEGQGRELVGVEGRHTGTAWSRSAWLSDVLRSVLSLRLPTSSAQARW